MKHKIEVTQQDIENGRTHSAFANPIAFAVRRAVGGRALVIVNGAIATGKYAQMPRDASDFLLDFDCGLMVSPFEFELEFEPI